MNIKEIEIVKYNPDWPKLFESEAVLIKQALGDNCIAVHHIGSTAVPELAAKPVIDILPVVLDITKVDIKNINMAELGYNAKGEYGIPLRRFFQKKINIIRTHNVHVFEQGNTEIDRHLGFRNWMRSHSYDREKYAELKQDLANRFPNDMMSYGLGKDQFIADVDHKAGFTGIRIFNALKQHEWDAVKNYRQKYFFDKANIIDPYTWTFDHPDHRHFVLYKGTDILGYAHLQLWSNFRAALRIIVIDEDFRNLGLGGDFLILCEKWLKTQGYKSLHIESSPETYNFYKKHTYISMPFNDPENHESHPNDIPIGKNL
ncbi:MAG: GNAT family N-acetyltransferase [Gammaproteobacteria bacterium]|nr:GNAT family N-acetyltransferase [Gammaproteobacteria bacterium]